MTAEIEVLETGVGVAWALAEGTGVEFTRAESITVQCGDTWAIKITKDGITSNPDVTTDEGAKAMFDALEPYLLDLKSGD